MMNHPQVEASEIIVEHEHPNAGRLRQARPAARFEGTPVGIRQGAPLLGEHTREILAEAGYGESDIERMIAQRVVTAAS